VVLGKDIKMENIALEAAVKLLKKESLIGLEDERVPLLEAIGRVLSEDVIAEHDQPPFDRSPLDGYAVRGEDTTHASEGGPIPLEVIDEVCAGHISTQEIKAGQAIRIMTGGPMPKGSNGVIKQEDTDEGMATVTIYKGIKANQNYCYAGEDYKAGSVLIEKGALLTAYHVGLLASNGMTQVGVKRRLRVGLISTGDELIEPGSPLGPGKIYNSNLYTLGARLKELGCQPLIIGTIHDDVNKGVALIKDHVGQVDLFITTGGVSVGKMDIMHPIFKALSMTRLFWKVQVRPGTPALAGLYGDQLVLALSGNPSAAAITFELLFRPLLSHINDSMDLELKKVHGRMLEDFNKKSPTRRLIKAYIEGETVSLTRGNHSSGALKSMVGCNCLIDVPPGSDVLKVGDQVQVFLI
jgi:molybdopterin molybdotransferase